MFLVPLGFPVAEGTTCPAIDALGRWCLENTEYATETAKKSGEGEWLEESGFIYRSRTNM